MNDKKIVEEIPFGRPGITLVKREGDNYWQMKNSDGDVWGKFYPEDSDRGLGKFPEIYLAYNVSGGELPLRVFVDNTVKYVDPNGFFCDGFFSHESRLYSAYMGHVVVPVLSGYRWQFRDRDGNCSQRVFSHDNNRPYYFQDKFENVVMSGEGYYDHCFEKDGKIKPLYDLETLCTSGEGIKLLREDEKSPIDRCVEDSAYDSIPLYFYKDKNGELSESFYQAWGYNNGWARVQKYRIPEDIQYRDEKGNLSRPFKAGTNYINGYAVVLVENKFDFYKSGPKKYCLRDIEGNLSTTWFKTEDEALEVIEAGNAQKYFEKRILDTKVDENKLKSYHYVDDPGYNGFRLVKKYVGGDYQFVAQDGSLSEPFYKVSGYKYMSVQKYWHSGVQARDLKTGNLSQEVYYVRRGYGDDNCCVIQLKPNGPYHLMDTEGNISEGFCAIDNEYNRLRIVQKSFYHPYQIIDKNWRLSKKKYPDMASANKDIYSGKFEKEKVATIKPRPKKVEQSTLVENKQTTTLISAMLDSNSTSEVAETSKPAPKTDLEKYLSNEISVYELDAEHFKGETLDKIIKHEKANYLQAITYFEDNAEKMAEIRKQTLEITEYIKDVACEVQNINTKQIDYKTAPIF